MCSLLENIFRKRFFIRVKYLMHFYLFLVIVYCLSLIPPLLQLSQQAVPCPKLTIETLEQGVKYVQS